MPEVKLGLLPGAGGTQRLPRAIGLEAALNMIVSGAIVPAARLKGTALLDEVTEGDPVAAAVALAEQVVAGKMPLKRLRDLKVKDPQAEAFLQFARNNVAAQAGPYPAPLKCLEAVAWSLSKPFDEGLRLEREAFLALMATPESRALRHVFTAERAAAKIADLPEGTPLRDIRKVGVIGAGTMGGGITMNFLNAGIPVVLLEMKQEALDKGLATIRKNYENSAKKGKLTAAQVEQRMALITPTLEEYAPFARCRPGDRGRVREHGGEGTGVPQARRGLQDAARSWRPTPLTSTSTASPHSPSAPPTCWACTSSARPT